MLKSTETFTVDIFVKAHIYHSKYVNIEKYKSAVYFFKIYLVSLSKS